MGSVLGGGEPTAPTADFDVVKALVAAATRQRASSPTSGPIVTSDVFYDPHPDGVGALGPARLPVRRDGDGGASSCIAMRERAKGRPVRAGSILTVSDVIVDPDVPSGGRTGDGETWFRPPEDEVTRRVDLTIGAAMAAAALAGADRARRCLAARHRTPGTSSGAFAGAVRPAPCRRGRVTPRSRRRAPGAARRAPARAARARCGSLGATRPPSDPARGAVHAARVASGWARPARRPNLPASRGASESRRWRRSPAGRGGAPVARRPSTSSPLAGGSASGSQGRGGSPGESSGRSGRSTSRCSASTAAVAARVADHEDQHPASRIVAQLGLKAARQRLHVAETHLALHEGHRPLDRRPTPSQARRSPAIGSGTSARNVSPGPKDAGRSPPPTAADPRPAPASRPGRAAATPRAPAARAERATCSNGGRANFAPLETPVRRR